MGSAIAHLVGNVATDLKKSLENQGHERVSFRLIANERRRDANGAWVDGDEFAVSVVCWGALARNVAASVRMGDPLQVSGRLATRRYDVEGETKYLTELKATQVGHDLNRGRSSFQRGQAGTEPAAESSAEDPRFTSTTATAAVEELMAPAF